MVDHVIDGATPIAVCSLYAGNVTIENLTIENTLAAAARAEPAGFGGGGGAVSRRVVRRIRGPGHVRDVDFRMIGRLVARWAGDSRASSFGGGGDLAAQVVPVGIESTHTHVVGAGGGAVSAWAPWGQRPGTWTCIVTLRGCGANPYIAGGANVRRRRLRLLWVRFVRGRAWSRGCGWLASGGIERDPIYLAMAVSAAAAAVQ